jgi:hypothetical protein
MADGMFNSGGGSSSGGGGGYNDYSTNYYGSRSSSGGDLGPEGMIVLAVVVVIMVVGVAYNSHAEAEALATERQLDRTTYKENAEANFDAWVEVMGFQVKEGSLFMEPGSSHRENYHCKGGQFFDLTTNRNITYCCAVQSNHPARCLEI